MFGEYVELLTETLKIKPSVSKLLPLKYTDPISKFKSRKYKVGDSWYGHDGVRYTIYAIKDKIYIAHDQSGNSMDIETTDRLPERIQGDLKYAERSKKDKAELELTAKQDAQNKKDRISLNGFEKELSKLELGKVAKALEQKISYNGKMWILRDLVYDLILNQHATVTTTGFKVGSKIVKFKTKYAVRYGDFLYTKFETKINPNDNYASDDDIAHLFGN